MRAQTCLNMRYPGWPKVAAPMNGSGQLAATSSDLPPALTSAAATPATRRPSGNRSALVPAATSAWRQVRVHPGDCYQNGRRDDVRIPWHPLPRQRSAPGPETQRLGALVGRWRSEGHIVGEVPVPITGTDTYEWLAGGFFLVHHVDVVIGEQAVQAIELIGEYDPANDSFTARSYDNRAISRSCGPGLTSTACGRSPVAATLAHSSRSP